MPEWRNCAMWQHTLPLSPRAVQECWSGARLIAVRHWDVPCWGLQTHHLLMSHYWDHEKCKRTTPAKGKKPKTRMLETLENTYAWKGPKHVCLKTLKTRMLEKAQSTYIYHAHTHTHTWSHQTQELWSMLPDVMCLSNGYRICLTCSSPLHPC